MPSVRTTITNVMSDDFAVDDVRTDEPATPDSCSVNVRSLYWSVRGEVACASHAPRQDSPRWSDERWAETPRETRSRNGIRYQCQYCADSKTPIVHRRLNTHIHL